MTVSRRDRFTRRRDAAVVVGLFVVIVVLLLAARADGGRTSGPIGRAASTSSSLPLPRGWHVVNRPLTGVIWPVQVFAASTYPIVLHHRPKACGPPPAVLAEMPPGGVLLQLIEYAPRALDGHPIRLPRLPRRPDRFTYADATWADYECAGPSYKFSYRQAGHALQAQVWMHRDSVDPALRAGALRILDHFDPSSPTAEVAAEFASFKLARQKSGVASTSRGSYLAFKTDY
jgi:hypothetical protein